MFSNKITHFKNNSLTIRAVRKTLFVGLAVLCFGTAFYGQTNYQISSATTAPNVAPGTPIGSYALSGFESVNPYSGKLNFSLPLISVDGRGSAGYTMNLKLQKSWSIEHNVYDPNLYTPESETYPILHNYYPTDVEYGSNIEIITGPGIMKAKLAGTNRFGATLCNLRNPCYDETLTRLSFEQSDGTVIEFRDVLYGGRAITVFDSSNRQSRGTQWVSTDGSNATFISNANIYDNQLKNAAGSYFPSGTLYLANGTRYLIENGWVREVTDVNGNKTIVAFPIKDSLGRDIDFTVNMNPITYEIYDKTITYKGTNGANRNIKIDYSSLESRLADGFQIDNPPNGLFPLPPPEYGGGFGSFNPAVVANVELPDGRKYEFKYNSYGELAEVKLPTGGKIEYVWQTSPGLYEYGGEAGNIYEVYRRVEKRRVYENNVLQNETVYGFPDFQDFSVTVETYQNNSGTLVLVNKTKHYYADLPIPGWFPIRRPTEDPHWLSGRELKTEAYDANGTLLRKTENLWEAGTPLSANPAAPINVRLAQVTETLADANLVSKKTFGYDGFNNQTDTYEYDYGIGAPGAFKRRSHAEYYITDTDYTSHTGAHLRSLPLQTWVSSDINGDTKASLTIFEYDNYNTDTNHAPLVSRVNVIGHDTANYGVNKIIRGNVTKVTTYGNAQTQSEPISAYSQFDILGNVVKTIDAKGYISTIDYSDRFGAPDGEARANTSPTELGALSTFAFPTSSTNALGWTTGYVQFDYYTGQSVDVEDINGVVGSTFYEDLLDRPTQTIVANNLTNFRQKSWIIYDDANRRVETHADLFSFGDGKAKSESFYDGLGRTIESRRYEADGNYVATKLIPFVMVQDPETQVWRAGTKSSNPYRPNAGEQPIWTTSLIDSLGRGFKVITPDGAIIKTEYSGNTVTVTDQALKQRRSITNGLGQLTRVDEPNDAGQLGAITNPNQPTNYSYDILNNLTTVQQGGQTRSFVYDSLSRLKQATNPESGLLNYSYDLNGNLTSKTDARNVTTSFAYDNLNRVLTRSYSDVTPQVSYFYDNLANAKGKLIKVSSAVSQTEYTSFDILGRVLAHKQTTDGQVYNTGYSYNLSSALIEETYPSGRVVKNVLDNDGDLEIVQSKKNANAGFFNYAKNFSYTSAGAVSLMQLGNGRWESTTFNSRLQPTQIALGTVQNGTDKLKLNFDYGQVTNNGNVLSQTITVPTTGQAAGFTAIQNYTYDSLNRLKSGTETIGGSQSWKQTFLYDRFGNRNFDTSNNNTTTIPAGCAVAVCNPTVNQTNNRLSGYGYDTAGNTTTDAQGRSFTYDADNKQTKVMNGSQTVGEYFYDGDGKRIKKKTYSGGVLTEETIFVYDAGGKLVAEYSNQTSATPQVSYLTNDHLGSPRITTDANGQVLSRRDFLPFGEELTSAQTAQRNINLHYAQDAVRQKFTAYERDTESELDFAEARYYNSKHGRFTTTDPIFFDMDRIVDPQQLNIYLYVVNNPLKYIDPTGLDIEINGDERQWAFDEFSKGLSFKTTLSDKNKVVILDKDGKQLDNEKDKKALNKMLKGMKDGPEKELFKAIIDTKNHGVLTANTRDDDVDIGETKGVGKNSVDRAEVEMLGKHEKDGGFSASDVVRHEAMEAYLSAKSGKPVYVPGGVPGKDYDSDSHFKNPFPGLTSTDPGRRSGNFSFYDVTILPGSKAKGSYTIKKEATGEGKKGKIVAVLYFKQ